MTVSLCAVVGVVALLLLIEWAAEKRDLRRYPAAGRFVADAQLHLFEMGVREPVVLLESGLAATSISWLTTQKLIAEFARVGAYDRAGLGWSTGTANAPTLNALLEGLKEVVSATSPHRPVVLVGHSFGGLLVMAFAHLYPDRVAGIVLVDPVSLGTYANPNEQHRQRLVFAQRLCRRGAALARFGIVRGALSLVGCGSNRLPQLIGRVSAGRGSSVMSRLASEVAKLPPETYGPIRSHWSRSGSFRLLADYLKLLPETARQAVTMVVPIQIPMVVLSASTATEFELAEREAWIRNRPTSRHTRVPDTTHWIHLDRADVVSDAVRQLIIK